MNPQTKKCPMCAESILLEAVVCGFCGAKFEVSFSGYCTNCHEMRRADANKCCTQCGCRLADVQITSEYVKPKPVRPMPPVSTPSSRPTSVQPAKKKAVWASIFGVGIILLGFCFLMARLMPRDLLSAFDTPTPSHTATQTSTPTQTPTPTRTPRPTSTPLPVEVTFETIGNYAVGQRVIMTGYLVMFSSTYCDYSCGLSLAERPGSSNSITIFVYVAKEGVEPEPNQMKALSDNFGKWDIRVRLNDGEYAFIGQRITVTGWICRTTADEACISDIVRVELAK